MGFFVDGVPNARNECLSFVNVHEVSEDEDFKTLQSEIWRGTPAALKRYLGPQKDDFLMEIITQAMGSHSESKGDFAKWCRVLASKRGWDIAKSFADCDDFESAPILTEDSHFLEQECEREFAGRLASDVSLQHECLIQELAMKAPSKQVAVAIAVSEGSSWADISRELGITREAVNYHRKRITQTLKEILPAMAA
jgi:transposase-like protein